MLSKYITPNVGTVGVIKLSEPFVNAVTPNVPYVVKEVRTLSGIAATGEDPFEKYYAAANIDREKYQQDVEDGVCILSLQSNAGQYVYVPNSYLTMLPQANGIPYTSLLVGVYLGPMPDGLDLSYFKSKLRDLARDYIGVQDADVRVIAASPRVNFSVDDSKAIEAAREQVMATVVTDYAKWQEAERRCQAATGRIAELEAYIVAHQPATTP